MTTSIARRRGRSRSEPSGGDGRRFAEAHEGDAQARASHLRHAARSAGEAFAWSGDEAPARRSVRARGLGSPTIWLAAGAVAAVGLYVAF